MRVTRAQIGKHVFALSILLAGPAWLPAQDETASGGGGVSLREETALVVAAAPVGAPEELLERWPYFHEVTPAEAAGGARWLDVRLTPAVFDSARSDLADLRLYDAQQREVPFALRVLRPVDTAATVKAREFDRAQSADGASLLSLDLGEDRGEHSEVEVRTAGADFRRRVMLEGSDDSQQWRRLPPEKNLLRFGAEGKTVSDETVAYSPSRFRYLRITVHRDPQVDTEPVKIMSVLVRRRVKLPGEGDTRAVTVSPREAVRAQGGWGSAWTIDLGGDNVPCERLIVDVADPELARNYQILAAGPPGSERRFQPIAEGVWQRRAGERKPLVAEFNEVTAARLRLVVTDHRNDPLRLQSVQASAAARTAVFASVAGPWRLYYGNPKAAPPNYDFARNLPELLEPAPARLPLGPRQDNPAYQPEPLPLTERWPWLIYVLLGVAVAILAVLIAGLARAAIAAADRREAVTG